MSTSDSPAGRQAEFPVDLDGHNEQQAQNRQDTSMSNNRHVHPNDPRYTQQYAQGQQSQGDFDPNAQYHNSPQYQNPQQADYNANQPLGHGADQAQNMQGDSGYHGGHHQQPQGQPRQGGGGQPIDNGAYAQSYGQQGAQQNSQEYYGQHGGVQDARDNQRAQMFGANAAPASGNDFDYAQAPVDQAAGLDSFRSAAEQVVDAGYSHFDGRGAASHDASEPFFGAQKQQADANFYENDYLEDEYEDESGGQRRMMMIAGLVGLLGVGGAMAYAYKSDLFGGGTKLTSAPPIIAADSNPTKETPVAAGGKDFPNRGKLFYERLGETNGDAMPPKPERIVSRQEAVDPALNNVAAPAKPAAPSIPPKPVTAKAEAPGGPVKVRTLTVLPNGRIVKASPEATAAIKPSIPAVKATDVKTVKPQDIPPAPVQVARANIPAAPKAQVVIPSPVTQAAQAAQSGFVVQVAARRSEADAQAAFTSLQKKYPSILSAYQPNIQKADLGEKGIYYRLRIGPLNSRDSASALCNKLKAAGQDCLVRSL